MRALVGSRRRVCVRVPDWRVTPVHPIPGTGTGGTGTGTGPTSIPQTELALS